MTLDEALGSVWCETGKTVEELLRTGKLTYQSLRVTANRSESEQEKVVAGTVWKNFEEAYARINPTRINQTFLVNLPNVGLSLEEASATPWKGSQHSGEPMGKLVDQGLLSMRDLCWAIESSYVPRVREAARVLMFQLLQTRFEAPAKNGSAKVIQAGMSYSKEKVNNIYSFGAVLAGFGGGSLWALSCLLWVRTPTILLWAIGLITLIGSLASLFIRLKTIRAHNQGADEEDRVAARLAASLDVSWTILRNVRKKGIAGDIDIVLVGPGGVFAIEVKRWKTELRIEGAKAFFSCDGKRKGGYGDPVAQARNNARSLYGYLLSQGLKVPVDPVLVVAVDRLDLASPAITVWDAADVAQEAAWLPRTSRLSFDAAKVVALLEESGGK